MNLVAIPFHDWKKCEREGFRTRDAHLIQEFMKNNIINKLLIINRPISISEILLLRRNKKTKNGQLVLKYKNIYVTKISGNAYTLDIVVSEFMTPLIMRKAWTPYIFEKEEIKNSVDIALEYLSMKDNYNLIVFSPLFIPLVKKLSPKLWAMDAIDNLKKQAHYKKIKKLNDYYQFAIDNANYIYTNSEENKQWLNNGTNSVTFIPNGVDIDFFQKKENHIIPHDVARLPRPIIGYAGKMQEMFDMEMLIATVKQLPNISFVFIGQQLNKNWIKELWKYPNTYYLGDKVYNELPNYLSSFDICIIPYSIERQHGGDPIKFYEYLAMNKPIVTTKIGGVAAFEDHPNVSIVNTSSEFIESLKMILHDTNIVLKTTRLPNHCLWKNKASIMLGNFN